MTSNANQEYRNTNSGDDGSLDAEIQSGADLVQGFEQITMDHLHRLKEYLGANQSDMLWLMGVPIAAWYSKSDEVSPTLALLTRLYDRHPILAPLPRYPSFQEMYDLIAPFFEEKYGKKLAATRMGTLFGVGKWAGYSWSKTSGGKEPSPTGKRLFLAAYMLIDSSVKEYKAQLEYAQAMREENPGYKINRGLIEATRKRGFNEFLEILETEAKSRGYDDLDDLYRTGWKNGTAEEEGGEVSANDAEEQKGKPKQGLRRVS